MSNLGHDVYSGPQVVENAARKRIFAAEGSEDDALIRLQNSKEQRTPLPTDRLEYAGMNIIVKTESFFAMAAQDPRYAVPIPYVNRIQSVSNLVPTLSMSGFEQTPNNQINPAFSKKAFNDVPASVNLNSHSFDPNSAIKSVFKPAPTFQATQQNILGYGNMPWDTMLFTKRAAIANLAKLGRSIKGAVKGRSGKLEILKVTQELAYAECTSVDVKQYMLTTPVDARAIRRIWPELAIFHATESISYGIIGQSLVEWGPDGIVGLEEFELIVLGWMRLADNQQLGRLDSLVQHKNEHPAHLKPFLEVRGANLNARFWTPKGLKKLREDIWEVVDGGEEFRRKAEPPPETVTSQPTTRCSTSHLSLLRDGHGVYSFRIQSHHLTSPTPVDNEEESDIEKAPKSRGRNTLP
ncbi:hypothetical protein IFR04_013144 [Cadophora malorum]|uniref:Uncharacterized protein n=1 Tax=Cadophora malorum TaxID=108018 RepID=A0A8H7T5B5_9HELO|nr:hypothetical protein IFR04_013144 [Cadophora malorum]